MKTFDELKASLEPSAAGRGHLAEFISELVSIRDLWVEALEESAYSMRPKMQAHIEQMNQQIEAAQAAHSTMCEAAFLAMCEAPEDDAGTQ